LADADTSTRDQVVGLAVQTSLLAAGSLQADILRSLVRRPALARRYLGLEGHRALAANEDLLPSLVRPLIDRDAAVRSDSPAASLTAAHGREVIADPPDSFGVIRAGKLLADQVDTAAATGGQHPGEPRNQMLAELAEGRLAWLSHARRLVRDYERLPEHSEALLTWAAVTLITRRLAEAA
jgi:hypothetical protein